MTKQEELLTVATDTNTLLKQQNRNLELLVEQLTKAQEKPKEIQKIGFVQNAVQGILDNPKTSLAGVSSLMLGISSKFFPQYSDIINTCLTGITGSGLLIARDAKPQAPPTPAPIQNEELLG